MTLVIIIIGPSDTSQDFSEWGLSVLLVYWLAWQRLMLWYTSVELEVSPVVSALTSHWDQFKGPEQPRGPNSQTHSSHANPNVVNMMCVCVWFVQYTVCGRRIYIHVGSSMCALSPKVLVQAELGRFQFHVPAFAWSSHTLMMYKMKKEQHQWRLSEWAYSRRTQLPRKWLCCLLRPHVLYRAALKWLSGRWTSVEVNSGVHAVWGERSGLKGTSYKK